MRVAYIIEELVDDMRKQTAKVNFDDVCNPVKLLLTLVNNLEEFFRRDGHCRNV